MTLAASRTAGVLFLAAIAGWSAAADQYSELFRKAAADAAQGRYEEAITRYDAALTMRPGAPEVLNNLAAMYYQTRRYPAAYEAASKIWRNHPELKSASLIAGLAAIQCDRPNDAIEPLKSLLVTDPANRDALLGLAGAYVALADFHAASDVYEREIALAATDSNAWYGAAICYERLAEDASRKLSHTPGGSAYSKRLLAEYLQSAGGAKLAAEAFGDSEASMADSTPEAEREYQRARALAAKSKEAFERFVSLAPGSWQAEIFRGDVERQHGNLTEALADYQKAAQAQPQSPAALLGMGTAYWELGDFGQASSCLRKVLAINPNSMQALFELANIAVRQNREADAIPLLQRYLAQQPDALAARADLGRAYLHLEQYDRAITELTLAAATDQRGDIHYQLASALRKSGRAPEADAAVKQAVELRKAQLRREQKLRESH